MADMLEVVLITEYRDRDDEKKARFTKLGMAFPYRDGNGYVLKMQALPVPTIDDESGEIAYVIHLREPYDADGDSRGSRGRSGGRPAGRDRGRSDRDRDRDRGRDDSRRKGRDEDRRERDLDDEIPF